MNSPDQSLANWIVFAKSQLRSAKLHYGHGASNANDEAAWLVGAACKLSPDELAASLDKRPDKRETRRIHNLLDKRIHTREPLAYLLGEAWLSGRKFRVDRRVIIPRSFIADLLNEELSPWVLRPRSVRHILDLCTGSACLAILAALAFPKARIDATDISKAALAVAKLNVLAYELGNRIRLIQSDLFQSLPSRRYDLIISNPPYVKSRTMRALPKEYLSEPALALEGGRDGLDKVREIMRLAEQFLMPSGLLVLEIGHNRRAFERHFPELQVTWLNVHGDKDTVILASADQLASLAV